MHITFHGAARNVTGSKHMVQLNDGTNILLDCGMFQGLENADDLNGHFGFRPDTVDYMVLSHAHIDHCGLIPRLVAEGFKGPIYCTPPTMNLARILMADSARIQTSDAEYANTYRERKGLPLEEPLYTEEDAMKALGQFKVVEYNEEFEITPRVKVLFTDAGHLLGSAAVHLNILEDGKYTQLTFSGDVGRYGDMILRSPEKFPQADYILLESTYGDSLHKDLKPIENALHDIIQHTCMVRHGKVIIPAFSVGRTQELLYALNALELQGRLPDVPYYVDSPLADQATQVLKEHPEVYNSEVEKVMKVDADPFSFKGLRFTQSTEESIALNNDPRPCVIISSSGMAEAGRVRHHIRNNIDKERNTILIVGYCEPSSLGGHLLRGDKVVNIFHEDYDVKAEVRSIKSMSAHGDYEDLLKFMSCQDPKLVKKVFLVHGEYDVQQHFAKKLQDVGFEQVEIPYQHQRVEI
ncbi:MBL fold metallo-hydrolase RNA specificity domain-containing protein [Mucilaginibacter jinjuensis]|uniref:MBL fold metallo-hydrolase n=1 Tax=Mucilaginibacter jinjuensis TaxID=1176721 RepID=A0ABY7T8X4_9SPHI|nr:MBL fold metallo-hydrolase [Mucilaginibacter jinjuensis]WCT12688.1 MBL fold metallo-hydrolase [Mucilaginibacter jinjuensis]